jgi:hypothetical protein
VVVRFIQKDPGIQSLSRSKALVLIGVTRFFEPHFALDWKLSTTIIELEASYREYAMIHPQESLAHQ